MLWLRAMRSEDLTAIVSQVLSGAPQWVRADLAAKEAAIRQRAEEALAAMIGAALSERG